MSNSLLMNEPVFGPRFIFTRKSENLRVVIDNI